MRTNRPQESRSVGSAALAASLLAAVVLTGCVSQTETELRREIVSLKTQVEDCNRNRESQAVALTETRKQLQTARGLTDVDMTRIFYPEKIEIEKLTGGADYDDQPGDDGVTVYLKPIDAQGDVIKVAGDITVQVFDLAARPGDNFITECKVGVDEAIKQWHSAFMTNHYTIKCAFPPGRKPQHDEVTVRVTFVDYLTKRVLTEQRVVRVNVSGGEPKADTLDIPPGPRPSALIPKEGRRPEPATRPAAPGAETRPGQPLRP